ncbi:MAG TPA: DUF1592 domain-containing protein, partial [Pirellulaceae bacterium]|nr:DUF1592 domain-containing protein [Pirellulaceae bacterium]
QRAIQMLRSGAMPPEDAVQPSDAVRRKIASLIEKTIYNIDCDLPADPGRVTIRRLNRAEYNNTIRDLIGVSFRPADDFPSDDVGGGFDNIGDVLTLPPLLMEKYLAAAERIAEAAIVADTSLYLKSQYRDRTQLSSKGQASYDQDFRRWTLWPAASAGSDFEFSRDGEYQLSAQARLPRGATEPVVVELRIDGRPLEQFEVVPDRDANEKLELKRRVTGGTHRLSLHLVPTPTPAFLEVSTANVNVGALEVTGPLDLRPEDFPPTHQRLIAARPGDKLSVAEAARKNLEPLLTRAFRRPATEGEVQRFATLAEDAVKAGDSFEQGMQVALTAALVSPHFLFRTELDARPQDPQAVRELGDYELASRLSYFLWSSMPDDELFALAKAGKLREPATLEQQIRRMLADPKSAALVDNFITQWLNLRLLDGAAPDPRVFPRFDNGLKSAMRRETELFAAAIIREDRSILDFVSGRFTYVNERLARHYGIDGIRGDEFRRVEFSDKQRSVAAGGLRSGVLTQASILTLTSNPGRTSPVKRGKWILENLLGSPPPDPPPDVPDLEATQRSQPNLPLRKQLEIHRQNAVCASCHKTMDQLGFGLENFDAVGRWRDRDGQFPVDASGTLPGGAKFNGPLELARVLDKRRGEFARCLAEKMLTFALGRELSPPDRCAVDKMVDEVERGEYRFSALVTAVVNSDPFRKRRGEAP